MKNTISLANYYNRESSEIYQTYKHINIVGAGGDALEDEYHQNILKF